MSNRARNRPPHLETRVGVQHVEPPPTLPELLERSHVAGRASGADRVGAPPERRARRRRPRAPRATRCGLGLGARDLRRDARRSADRSGSHARRRVPRDHARERGRELHRARRVRDEPARVAAHAASRVRALRPDLGRRGRRLRRRDADAGRRSRRSPLAVGRRRGGGDRRRVAVRAPRARGRAGVALHDSPPRARGRRRSLRRGRAPTPGSRSWPSRASITRRSRSRPSRARRCLVVPMWTDRPPAAYRPLLEYALAGGRRAEATS